MPIYEYHCSNCNTDFECLVLGKELPCCPSCNSHQIGKLMSACGFVSKGSGGTTVRSSAGGGSCAGCSTSSCAGCGH